MAIDKWWTGQEEAMSHGMACSRPWWEGGARAEASNEFESSSVHSRSRVHE